MAFLRIGSRCIPGFLILIAFLLICGCFPKYSGPEIDRFKMEKGGVELFFETRAGKQAAYYIPPQISPTEMPEHLGIFYPGIGSRALDWLHVVSQAPRDSMGILLIDYPGYGINAGFMRPKHLHESTFGALKALMNLFCGDGHCSEPDISLVAHSFGCAAALQFAAKTNVERIILIAPFLSLHRIAFHKLGPIAYLIPERLDNSNFLKEIYEKQPCPEVHIYHGDKDKMIPVDMGRELADLFPGWISYHEIAGADHVDVIKKAEESIFCILSKEKTDCESYQVDSTIFLVQSCIR